MQYVGQQCGTCGSKITSHPEAKGCHDCELVWHRSCEPLDLCSGCERSFDDLSFEQENMVSKSEHRHLSRHGLNHLVIGGVLLAIGATLLFLGIVGFGPFAALIWGFLQFLYGARLWLITCSKKQVLRSDVENLKLPR